MADLVAAVDQKTENLMVPSMQKAWIYKEYVAAKDILQLDDGVPIPEVKEDQVLIKVHDAALNPVDLRGNKGNLNPLNLLFL